MKIKLNAFRVRPKVLPTYGSQNPIRIKIAGHEVCTYRIFDTMKWKCFHFAIIIANHVGRSETIEENKTKNNKEKIHQNRSTFDYASWIILRLDVLWQSNG